MNNRVILWNQLQELFVELYIQFFYRYPKLHVNTSVKYLF